MRCGRCGNDNAEANRFCGMCGAVLAPKTQPSALGPRQAPAVTSRNTAANSPTAAPTRPAQSVPRASIPVERPAAPLSSFDVNRIEVGRDIVDRDDDPFPEPVISGPSFLGLNKPASPPAGFRADNQVGGRDHLRSSGNVDYLLDDDEEPKRGWGKVILVLLALALAGGFGYLRWKQGGFDWLKAGDKKPAATQAADAGQTGADTGKSAADGTAVGQPATPAANGAATTGTTSAPAAAPPATTAASTPAASAASTPTAENATPPPAATSASTPPASSTPSPGDATQNGSSADNSATPPQAAVPQGKPDSTVTTESPTENGASGSETETPDDQPAPKAASRATPKPAAKPSPARSLDTVADAQRYIYGRGVRQDCDRGLRMLKSAAGQSDAKAMISLGALYSTGTCAPRDLPTAYRWFAVALHKQPENLTLQDDLQKLWSQMTQPERQLAIKLSQ